jgi:hypothetical protein
MIVDFEVEVGGIKKIVKFRKPMRKDIRVYRKTLLSLKAEADKPENQDDSQKVAIVEKIENAMLDSLASLNICGTFKSHGDFEEVSGDDLMKLLQWVNKSMQINLDDGFLQK